ncbi:uncharacterized protein HLK63_H09735 [Nakaseomyces glabratus]|nr:uncharacterized protein GW608_H09735 [Nakaseomyces glabratus]UCS26433.1 uncharacterized protein HLK63_H09735 [Nakaseomyces glabratus]UCS31663.1 uncharacterized protein HLK64_H09735 [Nakaseomyces glabratus]UCS36891.1 uncharacterized protein HLK62_H09735 [Nakaseomyces glabratus]
MKSARSPFKKFGHSRENSTDETKNGGHKRTASGHSGHKSHSRQPSGSNIPPVAGNNNTNGHKHNSSRASNSSQNSNFLADQYERDRKAIIKYCFSKPDPKTGVPPNNYITHVRIIEDSKSPNMRPPPDSKLENKKKRVLIVSSKANNTKEVQLHKARENNDKSFQIGRTWTLKELVKIEADSVVPEGFTFTMGKVYYWETNTAKERTVFLKSVVSLYIQTFEGKVPELINLDLSLFYLDEKSYSRAVITRSPSSSLPSSPLRATPNLGASHGNSGIQQLQQAAVTAPAAIPPMNKDRVLKGSNVTPINTSISNVMTMDPPMRSPNRQTSRLSNDTGGLSKSPYANNTTINDVHRNYGAPAHSIKSDRQDSLVDNSSGKFSNSELGSDKVIANSLSKNSTNDKEGNEMVSQHSRESKGFKLPSEKRWSSNLPDDDSRPDFDDSEYNKPPQNRPPDLTNPGMPEYLDKQNNSLRDRPKDNLLEDLNAVLASDDFKAPKTAMYANEDLNSSVISEDGVAPLNLAEVIPLQTKSVEALAEPIDLNESPRMTDDYPIREDVTEDMTESYLDDTKEDTTEMSFEKNDEVRYSHGYEPQIEHVYHEVSTIQEEPDLAKVPARNTDRLKKVDEVPPINVNINDEALMEILTDIHWDVENDDADTLLEKVNTNLSKTEYMFNTSLLTLSKLSNNLQPYETNVNKACDNINPTFSLFLMEMSNCSEDIDYVESQNNGLQIESANKKQLWSTLDNLLKIVSLDEETLNKLLNCPIREKNLPWIEEQLDAMCKAYNAIEGAKNNDESNLRDLEALRQRREFYERVTKLLIDRMVDELGRRFSNLHNSSTSSEQVMNILNNLLVFSPLILFCKIMSPESYEKLLELWNANSQAIHKTIWDKEFAKLDKNEIMELKANHAILMEKGTEQLLKQWKHFKTTRKTTTDEPIYGDILVSVLEMLESLQKQCIYYQNFIDLYFHISSTQNFTEAIKAKYSPEYNHSLLASIHCIESDREAAVKKMDIVSKAFQSVVTSISVKISDILKEENSVAPALMLYLEQKIKELESTNQDYLSSAYNRLLAQINQSWSEFLEESLVQMERSFHGASLSDALTVINNTAVYMKNIQDLFEYIQSQMKIENTNTFDTVSIVETGCTTLTLRVSKILDRKNDGGSIISGIQGNNSQEDIENTIALIINSNSMVEFLMVLNNYMGGILESSLQESKNIFDCEKEIYAAYILRETMPKLTSFVNGATNMLNTQSAMNNARFAAYSKHNLQNILAGYSSKDIGVIIEKFHQRIIEQFNPNGELNPMEIVLCDKLWSCLQGNTVSLYLKLQTLIEKVYPGVSAKFTKNDIISAFEKYRK